MVVADKNIMINIKEATISMMGGYTKSCKFSNGFIEGSTNE